MKRLCFVLFVCFVVAVYSNFAQRLLFAEDCPPNCEHPLENVTLSITETLIDVLENGDHVYCLAVAGDCDAPPVNAEMVAGDVTWTLTKKEVTFNDIDDDPTDAPVPMPTLSSKGQEGLSSYSGRWGYEITIPSSLPPNSITVTFTAKLEAKINKEDGTLAHTYVGTATTSINLEYDASDVTPKPCTDICEPINCDACVSDSEPDATCSIETSAMNSPLGGQGTMIFPTAANIRLQNFSHNQGQAETTLDYIIDDQEAAKLGVDSNFRQDNKFGNGVRFIRIADRKEKIVKEKPKFITIELLQYGPILFDEPKRMVYDASGAEPNKSYRFSIPLFLPELLTGNYYWQARLIKEYADGTKETSDIMGRQGFFNAQTSPVSTGWVFGLMPKLEADGDDVLFLYQGMHKFRKDGDKWVTPKTYDTSDYNLSGNWQRGFVLTSKDQVIRKFDSKGKIQSVTQPNGKSVSYKYNDEGQLAQKILSGNEVTNFIYDEQTGYLREVISPQNHKTLFEQDENGRVTKVTTADPDGEGPLSPTTLQFSYDKDGLLTSIIRPNGAETKYEYDHAKRLSKIIHPDGRVESFICPITAGIVDTQNGEGTKDKPAKLVPTDSIAGTKIVGDAKTTTKYDVWGFQLEVIDPMGTTTMYKRNARGQVTEEIHTAVDENGKQIFLNYRNEYDSRGNRVKEILPFERGVQIWEFDKRTNAIKKFVAETGEVTIFDIDPLTGNTIRTESFENEKAADAYTEELYSYSPLPVTTVSIPGGLLIAKIDPVGYATGNAYNSKGKLVENFQYAENGERHTASGTGEWNFEKLTPNKRYEVFVTWTKDAKNSARTKFEFYQKDKTELYYWRTVNQKLEPHKHIYGSLGQKEVYQSIGQITAKDSSIKIKAIKTDKGVGTVAAATIRLVEIETLAIYRYDKDGRLISQSDATGNKSEHSYDSLGNRTKTVVNDTQTTETFYDYAKREAYSKDQFGIISGKNFDAVDRSIEEFNFPPDVKPVGIAIKNDNAKTVVGTIDNLDANKRYEVSASWKADAKNSTSAKFTVKSGDEILLTKNVNMTIGAGKHPIAGNDYRSLGIIETKNGTANFTLEADNDISLENLKIIEIESQARYRYDDRDNLAASTDQFGNTTRYEHDKLDRRTKVISPTLDPKRPESITETVYDVAGNVSKQIDPYGFATEHFYNPFGEVVKTIQTDDDRRGTERKLVTENRRDKSGRVIETINPAGQKTAFKHNIRGQIIETINNLGQSEKTEYDKRGNTVAQIDAAGNKTVFQYNLQGKRIATILPKPSENESSTITRQFYNFGGRLLSTVSPSGMVNSFLYDKYGRNIAQFIGLLLDKPTEIRNGKSVFVIDGILPNEEYDLFVHWKPDPNVGKTTVNFFYNEALGKSVTKSLGEIDLSKQPVRDSFLVPFCNDSYQRLTSNTKIFGNIVRIEFDGEVKNVSVYLLRSQAMSRTNYNDKGQVQSQIDARGNSVAYTYDNFGRQFSVIHDGEETSCCREGKTFYNQFGQTLANLAPDGKLMISGYDGLGRQDKSYLGVIAEIKSNEYKLEGLPIGDEFDIYVTKNKNEINANDTEQLQLDDLIFVKQTTIKTTESTFTGKLPIQSGKIAVIRKQPIQRVEFDFAGRTIASYDEKNNQTSYFYDSSGRQIALIQPPSGEADTRLAMESYFDLAGNTIAQISVPFEKDTLKPIASKKRVTRMEYDPLNRLVKIIQPNPQFPGDDGPITRQEYDLLGNVVKTIDPLGNATNYRYDNLNRKISETNAEGGITTFTYHEDGQMSSLTDPVGNTTSWTYNLLGRVSREMITLDKKMRTRYFYYDVAGNIIIKVDRNNRVTSWTYDKLNRPTSEVWHDTWRSFHESKQPIKKFTTTYNHSGKIATTEDGDNKFTFAYGIFGNEIKQTQNLADLEKPIEFNYATDINGLKTEKILKVADKIDHVNKYEVDALNRISKISQVIGDNEIKSVDIQYDDLGQLVKQTRFDSGKEIIVTKNKYDLAGHLTNISHTGNNKTIYADYDLKWDNANRITDFDFTYLNGPEKRSESKYRYDKTSQLINASYNFMQHEKYDFDLNGNRKQAEIQGQKQSYKTGEYNRLLSDENYSYEYDLEGNRISKTDKEGKTTKYSWDNRNRLIKVVTPTSEIEYLYDYQNRLVKRTENKTNQQYFVHDKWQIILQCDNKELIPTHRYLWRTKQDELISDNNNWTLSDHLSTIRDIVKSDGSVVSHLEYNSFGKLVSEIKNTDTIYFAYTGKLTDKSSDLQWNINRWYDSNVGRWMSVDPIGFEGGDINLFRYVFNSHLSLVDQLGKIANVAFEVAGKVLTVVSIGTLVQQAVGIGSQCSMLEGKVRSYNILTPETELDAELKKNRDKLKERKLCATRHVVKWKLNIYNSDNGASTLRDTYALHGEEGTYSFDEESVKAPSKKPIKAIYSYPVSVRCSNTTTKTCASVYLSEEGKEFDELMNGGKLCDWGYSVKLRQFITAYLYSYGKDHNNKEDSEPVVSTVEQEKKIWTTLSCTKEQPHP